MTVGFPYPSFRQPGTIIFGGGSRKTLTRSLNPESTVIFLSGKPSIKELLELAWGSNSELLSPTRVLVKPEGEPTLEMINFGAEFIARVEPRIIVGIGGGSVMDWCRLSWAASKHLIPAKPSGAVRLNDTDKNIDFWLLPTTPASGAESATVAVMLDSDGNKIPVSSECFSATKVILDSHFIRKLPPNILANSIGDILSHSIESALSIVQNPFAFDASVAALSRLIKREKIDTDSCDADLLLEAASLGGIAASNASVGAAHAFAHAVACHSVGHAFANAVALPAVIRLNRTTKMMPKLLDRLNLDGPEALIKRVEILTQAAECTSEKLLAKILKSAERETILNTMEKDVCLRTNAKRLDRGQLESIVESVVERLR